MSKVSITRSKLDNLASTVAAKSGAALPLTLDQMDAAVQGIETGGITPTGTVTITQNGTVDVTQYASASVNVEASSDDFVVTLTYNSTTEMWEPDCTYAEAYAAYQADKVVLFEAEDLVACYGVWDGDVSGFFYQVDALFDEPNGTSVYDWGVDFMTCVWTSEGIELDDSGKYYNLSLATATPSDVAQGKIFYGASGVETGTASGSTPTLQAKTATPTESQQVVEPDSGYDGLSSVTVGAISSTYVGSGITQRSSSDLTASGATVTVPAGYYASQATKAVSSGTAGTPTAAKGSVSNHSLSVTPSVTNTAGYISGGTQTGTAVSVSASELVSGTYSVTSSGTHDVTNYASASVASGSATASATKGSVSNHSVTVTPSVTCTAGWVTAGSANGTAVTVSASELVSGNLSITQNGTGIDVTNYATVSVAVPTGGSSMNAQSAQSTSRSTSTSYTELVSLTCDTAGTYDVYWTTFRTSTSGTWGSQLYLGNTAYGSAQTGSWSNHVQNIHLTGVQIDAGEEVAVRARSRGNSYYAYVGTLTIIQTA